MTAQSSGSMRKRISVGGEKTSSTELHGLLNGEQKLQDMTTALNPVSKLAFNLIKTTPSNPRYQDLCTAHIQQIVFQTGEGTPRHASSTHINKLARNRMISWIPKVREGWLQSEPGKAWLASETKSGHQLNFDNPSDKEVDAIWKAYMRRWIDRVERMLKRDNPDAATMKRWVKNGYTPQDRQPLDAEQLKLANAIVFEWNELLSLAASVKKNGLISPVAVRPVSGHFEIVGGERRYWACRLASMDRIPVVGAEIDDLTAMAQQIHENLDRLDVSYGSQVRAMRRYISRKYGEPCGPRNKQLKISLFENEFAGRSRSWSNRWRSLCRLPEDSDLLQSIYDGDITGVNEIDSEVRSLLKQLKCDDDSEARSSANPATTTQQKNKPQETASTPAKATVTSFKFAKLGASAGVRMLTALKTIEGIDEDTKAVIETAMTSWPSAADKQRKALLESVMTTLASALSSLDQVNG